MRSTYRVVVTIKVNAAACILALAVLLKTLI